MTKDNDLLICELQHDLEEYKNEVTELVNKVKYSDGVIKNLCEELKKSKKENTLLWDIVTEICEDSNPSYLYDMRIKAEEKVKEIYNG